MLVRSVLEKAGFAVRVVGSFPAVTAALYEARNRRASIPPC